MNNNIELKNLYKIYDHKNVEVLNNINFKFKKGKIYSLMGPSGSGKSTLLNLISLIDRPTKGKVKIENKDINFNENKINDKIRANKMSYVSENLKNHNSYTSNQSDVWNNIRSNLINLRSSRTWKISTKKFIESLND